MGSKGSSMPSTSALAAAWCNRLQQFCTHLEKNCSALHAIVQRKAYSESDDALDSFLEDLNDDVSSAMADIQHLERKTTDTLSFEELLAHCTALYKWNEDGISKLEQQLQQYGYSPVPTAPKQNLETLEYHTNQAIEINSLSSDGPSSPTRPTSTPFSADEVSVTTPTLPSYESKDIKVDPDYSPLFGDLSLEDLGISATSLTALASRDAPGEESTHPLQQKLFEKSPAKDDRKTVRGVDWDDSSKMKYNSPWTSETERKRPALPSYPPAMSASPETNAERHLVPVVFTKPDSERHSGATVGSTPATVVSTKDESVPSRATNKVVMLDKVTSAQFDKSPSWLTLQVSLQELNDAVTKINEVIQQRSIGGEHADPLVLDQEVIKALGLGAKSKAGLVLLVKAKKLVTQFSNGVTTYRVCV